jgi:type IV pilus assembly protein PilV
MKSQETEMQRVRRGAGPRKYPASRLRGFTIVEALVALVVLAVGLLGIAGLYVISLRSGAGAIYRMQAVGLTSELADRIRANRTANVAYAAGAVAANCVGGAVNCTSAQMAGNDLFQWDAELRRVLPNPVWQVQAAPVGGGLFTYTISVQWTESGQESAGYTVNFQI